MEEPIAIPTAFVFSAATVDAIEVCLILAIVVLVCVATYELVPRRR